MHQYILRRVLLLIPTMLGVSIVIFAVMRFLPGDVIDQLTGESTADPAIRHQISERYGLDKPLYEQYFRWLGDIGSGSFGTSILSRRTVASELQHRGPVSLQLGIMALAVSLLVALPVGVLSAAKQDSPQDYVARGFAIFLLAIPNFWLGTLVVAYGFVWFGWTPPLRYTDLWVDPIENLKILWIPAVIVGCSLGGSTMRIVRSAMLEVLRQDYIRTAHAKGLSGWTTITRHGLRNALLPVVTLVALQVPIVISGTVVVERIFSLPGVGSYLLSSVQQRDYPVVQAIVFIASAFVVGANLIVDILYTILDPRIRYG